MKKRTKRLMVLGLVLSMALTGCQGSDSTGAADGAASAAASADSDQTTFDVLAVRAINSDDQYLEGFVKESQETAGVTINWDIQQGSDWGDKKSVVLASADDLPDAFFGGKYVRGRRYSEKPRSVYSVGRFDCGKYAEPDQDHAGGSEGKGIDHL